MSRVTVLGHVPVYVVVDTEQRTVDQVVVDDESFSYDDKAVDVDGNEVAARLASRAKWIAEHNEWPGWDFGW